MLKNYRVRVNLPLAANGRITAKQLSTLEDLPCGHYRQKIMAERLCQKITVE
jgi:hypothetical protein